jgi:hypothetical protein
MEDISLHFTRAGRLVVQGTHCEEDLEALGIPWERLHGCIVGGLTARLFLAGFLEAP